MYISVVVLIFDFCLLCSFFVNLIISTLALGHWCEFDIFSLIWNLFLNFLFYFFLLLSSWKGIHDACVTFFPLLCFTLTHWQIICLIKDSVVCFYSWFSHNEEDNFVLIFSHFGLSAAKSLPYFACNIDSSVSWCF